MLAGSFTAAYTTKIGKPEYGFAVGASVTALVTFFSLFMDDSFEEE
jgi:hypothetical protein